MKSKWFQPMQMFFASPASGLGGDGGAGSGAGAPTPPAGGSGGGSAPVSPPQGTPPATIDWTTAPQHLRSAYEESKRQAEELKKGLEPWQKLGVKPEEVQQFQGGYKQVHSEILSIAKQLDVPEAEISDAIKAHGLVKVLDFLRNEAWEAQQAEAGNKDVLDQRQLEERIQAGIDQRFAPIAERENQRLVATGNQLVENTITGLASADFKAEGLDWNAADDNLKNFIMTGVTEALKYDDEGLRSVKFDGKVAPIQKAYKTFKGMFDAAYLARRTSEAGARPANRSGAPPAKVPPQGKRPTLEEMADNPDKIREYGGRPAYSS